MSIDYHCSHNVLLTQSVCDGLTLIVTRFSEMYVEYCFLNIKKIVMSSVNNKYRFLATDFFFRDYFHVVRAY